MSFKNVFLIFFIFFFTNLKADNLNLKKNYIPLKDFIILKFDLLFQKNLRNIYSSSGLMVAYQNLEQEVKIGEKDNINIIINAYMSKKRYSAKKYFPKLSDCNQVRNKLYVNKFGYSFFMQKKNNNVNSANLFNSISEDILDISILDGETKKNILEKTKVKINVIHPESSKSLSCGGNILDPELATIK